LEESTVYSPKHTAAFGLDEQGYDCENVDVYLTQLEAAARKLIENNEALRDQIGRLAADNDRLSGRELFVMEMLTQAKKEAEQIKRGAQAQADALLAGAEAQVRALEDEIQSLRVRISHF